MKYKLIIFDMDGTILDTLDDLTCSLNYALSGCGFAERTLAEARNFVGNGIRLLVERAAPKNASEEEVDRVYSSFCAHYKLHCYDKTKPYAGVVDLLKRLKSKGYKTAVVSNKADFAVQELCDRFFCGLFDARVGERSGMRRKPHPDLALSVLTELNVNARQAVYVGDSEVDLQTAQNAGLDCISVSWGFKDRSFLVENGATIIVSSPSEIDGLV